MTTCCTMIQMTRMMTLVWISHIIIRPSLERMTEFQPQRTLSNSNPNG